jgi:hypothetical protein
MRLPALAILLLLSSCTPKPTQPECLRYRDCRSCAIAGCGWCEGVGEPRIGCYSLREPRICGPATQAIGDCGRDVTDPGSYPARPRFDGGAP